MKLDRLHAVMTRHVEHGGIPGLVTLVRVHGETHLDAIGQLSLAEPERAPTPMRADSIFRIASMTKPITAVATLLLVDEGKLTLDAPVDHWLPELANRRVLRSLESPFNDTIRATE
jgi:CubicO group peptidase (beta-lactamase class C family)